MKAPGTHKKTFQQSKLCRSHRDVSPVEMDAMPFSVDHHPDVLDDAALTARPLFLQRGRRATGKPRSLPRGSLAQFGQLRRSRIARATILAPEIQNGWGAVRIICLQTLSEGSPVCPWLKIEDYQIRQALRRALPITLLLRRT